MNDNLEWADHVGMGAAKASRKIARLTKQRDELREALIWVMHTSPSKSDYDDAIDNAMHILTNLNKTDPEI